MTENCLVSVATGNYVRNLDRMEAMTKNEKNVQFMAFRDILPRGSLMHRFCPYHFKPMAIQQAYDAGHRTVIWFDSVIVNNRPLEELFNLVKQNGYLVIRNGWTSGQWCADSALEPLGVTREELMSYPHAMACVLGFDLSRPDVLDVFNRWKMSGPAAFPGPWNNQNNAASSHPEVLGHRHDQTAISVFAHKAGWRFTPPDENRLLVYGKDETYYLNSYHAEV